MNNNINKGKKQEFINLIDKISKTRLEFNILQNKNDEKEKKAIIKKIIFEEYTELFKLMISTNYLLKDNIEEDVIDIIKNTSKHAGTISWASNFLRANSRKTKYTIIVEAFNNKIKNPNTIKSIENCLSMVDCFYDFIDKNISIEERNKLSIQPVKSFLENKRIQNNISISQKNNTNKVL